MRAFYRNWEPAGYWRPRRVAQAVQAGRGKMLTLVEAVRAGCDLLVPDLDAATQRVARTAGIVSPDPAWSPALWSLPEARGWLCFFTVLGPLALASDVADRLLDEPVLWLMHDAENAEIRAGGVTAAVRRGRLRDDVAFMLSSHTLDGMSDLAVFVRYGADGADVLSEASHVAAGLRALRRDDARRFAHESAGGGRIEHLGSRRGRGGGRQSAAGGQAHAAVGRQ